MTFRLCLIIALAVPVACSHYEPLPNDQITRLTPEGNEMAPIPKKKILVLPTLNKTPYAGHDLSNHFNTVLANSLISSHNVLLVRPEELGDPAGFVAASGLQYHWKAIFDRARQAGVIGAIGSSLDELWFREAGDDIGLFRSHHQTTGLKIQIELYDTHSEQQIAQKSDVGELTEDLLRLYTLEKKAPSYDENSAKNAITRVVVKTLNHFNPHINRLGWSSRIAKIDFHRFYINAGEVSGITRGQLLKVYNDGPPVFDPDTNVFMGRAPGTFKGLLRVIDFFGHDGAVAVLHSGGNFKEKDRVEVYLVPPK